MADLRAVIETTTRLELYNTPPRQQQTIVRFTEEDRTHLIRQTSDLYPIMRRLLLREDRNTQRKEHFWVVGLNHNNRILYIELVSLGAIVATIANPIEVYQLAVINKSYLIVLVHNHIDGPLEASERDKKITERLIEGGKLLGITVLDHLIISEDGYYSFRENGLIELEEEEP
uniref:RadC-like JAB domain-containing protein n=1 Tax=Candidatus Kentrum sp. DK TaxID=2126562 RepID=A0A450TMK7_9GAMM|nr:MAG: RadC-like JAB domain-containing protein [Candidatus Kentron sp. DK]